MEFGYKHYEPEDVTRESHFPVHDAIEGDSEVPTTHVLSAEFKLKGDKERKASTELRYSVTKDTLKHKVQFFYERDPFSPKEQEKTKVLRYYSHIQLFLYISYGIKYHHHRSKPVSVGIATMKFFHIKRKS